jgi:hypothetical protein
MFQNENLEFFIISYLNLFQKINCRKKQIVKNHSGFYQIIVCCRLRVSPPWAIPALSPLPAVVPFSWSWPIPVCPKHLSAIAAARPFGASGALVISVT